MKIVLTNDDGVDAPGLQALTEKMLDAGEIIVAAPDGPRSGVGHQVTTHSPIEVTQIATGRYSINGTPADCTRIALKVLAPDADWLIAGINCGANLGSDVYNSGTVAAAREAAILGCRSIAISQYVARDHTVDWDITAWHAGPFLKMLMEQPPAKGKFWNVNLPHPLERESAPEPQQRALSPSRPGGTAGSASESKHQIENPYGRRFPAACCGILQYEFCELDTGPHNYVYRREGRTYVYEGTIHERPRQPGRDVDVCFGGKVAITLLKV